MRGKNTNLWANGGHEIDFLVSCAACALPRWINGENGLFGCPSRFIFAGEVSDRKKKTMKYVQYFETPIGWMGAAEEDSRLVEVFFGRRPLSPGEVSQRTDLLARTVAQLGEYFSGQRRQFDLPLGGQGSAFSRAVWQALLGIPYGQTCTYGQLAAQVGRPRASRAVGRACHVNPLALVIPCHRVVGADGSLTGYAGGMAAKAFLLALEARSSGR